MVLFNKFIQQDSESYEITAPEREILGLPMNYFFLLVFVGLFLLCILLKKWQFNRFTGTTPDKVRRATAADGHPCSTTYEVEVDNWLSAQRIPHKKPEYAEYGEFFSNSDAVPNFVVYYPSRKLDKIHSIIWLVDIPRRKKYKSPPDSPDVEPKYRCLKLTKAELSGPEWREKAHVFYKKLRKIIIEWARKEGVTLIDLREKLKQKKTENER